MPRHTPTTIISLQGGHFIEIDEPLEAIEERLKGNWLRLHGGSFFINSDDGIFVSEDPRD